MNKYDLSKNITVDTQRPEKTITAFTLAEVLVTLVVIGVLSALVIPSLMTNIQDAQHKMAWKKTYSDLDQDIKRLMVDNGGTLAGIFQNNNDFNNKMLNYLNYSKKCFDGQSTGNCWHSGQSLLELSGDPEDFWANDNRPGAVLTSGVLLYVYFRSQNCSHTATNTLDFGICGQAMVDVNGFKGPNIIGKDVFGIWVKGDGIVPYGVKGDNFIRSDITTCSTSKTGWGCSAQYLMQ